MLTTDVVRAPSAALPAKPIPAPRELDLSNYAFPRAAKLFLESAEAAQNPHQPATLTVWWQQMMKNNGYRLLVLGTAANFLISTPAVAGMGYLLHKWGVTGVAAGALTWLTTFVGWHAGVATGMFITSDLPKIRQAPESERPKLLKAAIWSYFEFTAAAEGSWIVAFSAARLGMRKLGFSPAASEALANLGLNPVFGLCLMPIYYTGSKVGFRKLFGEILESACWTFKKWGLGLPGSIFQSLIKDNEKTRRALREERLARAAAAECTATSR